MVNKSQKGQKINTVRKRKRRSIFDQLVQHIKSSLSSTGDNHRSSDSRLRIKDTLKCKASFLLYCSRDGKGDEETYMIQSALYICLPCRQGDNDTVVARRGIVVKGSDGGSRLSAEII